MAFTWPNPANPLPTGAYQNEVTTGQTFTDGNIASWDVLTAGEVLAQAEWTGLYMFPILWKYYKHLNYLLFDYNKPGQKSLKSKFLPIDGTITTDGKSLTWYDYSMFDVETIILADAAASTTITIAKTGWYEAGDTILVNRKDGSGLVSEKRTIASVIEDTSITLTSAIAVQAGDKIVRAFYVQEAQKEITRGASTWDYVEYKSFFQTFARTLGFEKSQLNRTYFFEKSAKEYVASMFSHNMSILLQEFNKALYLGWNVTGSKSQMLGIDTAIEKAAETDPSLKVDFGANPGGKAVGTIKITGWVAADTWTVTIGSDAGTAEVFDTDLDTTATNIAADITSNITGYSATATGVVITVTADAEGATWNRSIDVAVTDTATADADTITTGWADIGTYTDDEKIKIFMDSIEYAASSGATQPGEVITVLANRKFISALGYLKKEDIVYNDKITEIDYNIITFKNMFGSIEVVWDPMLDKISQNSLGYMLPKSLITCKFRANQTVENEMGTMNAAKGEISVMKKIDNIPDVSEFYMYFEAALVLWGLSSGAYMKLQNL